MVQKKIHKWLANTTSWPESVVRRVYMMPVGKHNTANRDGIEVLNRVLDYTVKNAVNVSARIAKARNRRVVTVRDALHALRWLSPPHIHSNVPYVRSFDTGKSIRQFDAGTSGARLAKHVCAERTPTPPRRASRILIGERWQHEDEKVRPGKLPGECLRIPPELFRSHIERGLRAHGVSITRNAQHVLQAAVEVEAYILQYHTREFVTVTPNDISKHAPWHRPVDVTAVNFVWRLLGERVPLYLESLTLEREIEAMMKDPALASRLPEALKKGRLCEKAAAGSRAKHARSPPSFNPFPLMPSAVNRTHRAKRYKTPNK